MKLFSIKKLIFFSLLFCVLNVLYCSELSAVEEAKLILNALFQKDLSHKGGLITLTKNAQNGNDGFFSASRPLYSQAEITTDKEKKIIPLSREANVLVVYTLWVGVPLILKDPKSPLTAMGNEKSPENMIKMVQNRVLGRRERVNHEKIEDVLLPWLVSKYEHIIGAEKDSLKKRPAVNKLLQLKTNIIIEKEEK